MIDRIQHHNYRIEQAIFLGSTGTVLVLFGLAVFAQQYRRGVRPTWPLPGGLVGATFLVAVGGLPIFMTTLRLNLFDWSAYGWQQTLLYFLLSLCSVSTIVRWWRFGLSDEDVPWEPDDPDRRTVIRREVDRDPVATVREGL